MIEMNIDGLIGPTHHYAGLSQGNLASERNARKIANPRAAALQGLHKMRLLHDAGIVQGVLPPHHTPRLEILRDLGFSGSNEIILASCAKSAPQLLSAISSAAAMWAANAATVSASADTADGRVHFTPANLHSMFHRSLETNSTAHLLHSIFSDTRYFVHHTHLPAHSMFADEGAANHNRLCFSDNKKGITLFVYGRSSYEQNLAQPQKFPARQTLEASQAVARAHLLDPAHTFFVQQNPAAIDSGAFHNDVIAVAHQNLFFCHEQAFVDQKKLRMRLENPQVSSENTLSWLEVPSARISLSEAVDSYLFNSQIVTLPSGGRLILSPEECRENKAIWDLLTELTTSTSPLVEVKTLDLTQSMRNGGGPACLRLRVPLTEEELGAVHPGIRFTTHLHAQLKQWIERYYRDRLSLDDLADPLLLREVCEALDSLSDILHLGSVYAFQRN